MKGEPGKLLVTLTVDDLRAIVREELASANKQTEPPPRWVDVKKAAEHAGVTTKTIHRWIDAGLPVTHLGRDYRLRITDLDDWLEKHRTVRLKAV
jgi:excisionase family DNA binding protein